MQGLFVEQLRRFVESQYPGIAFGELVQACGAAVDRPLFRPAVSDTDFQFLLAELSRRVGLEEMLVQKRFGAFLLPGLLDVAGVMGLLSPEWGPLDLIEAVDHAVHQPLKTFNARVHPPMLRCLRVKYTELALVYRSQRRLCGILEGMIQGVADLYGATLRVSHPVCMMRGSPVCRLRILWEIDTREGAALDLRQEFREILQQGGEVKIFNLFEGFPVTDYGHVLRRGLEAGAVWVQMPPRQLAALVDEGRALLASRHVRNGFEGTLDRVDWGVKAARLVELRYAQGALGQRRDPRVQPSAEVVVRLSSDERPQGLLALLADLSENGLALWIDPELDENLLLYQDFRASFRMETDTRDEEDLVVGVTVLGVGARGGQRRMARLIFTQVNTPQQERLGRFIEVRRKLAFRRLNAKTPR
ncbi:MAG: heme NO-binding domain-containing protein [Magnetococcus sp. WYHC-3]